MLLLCVLQLMLYSQEERDLEGVTDSTSSLEGHEGMGSLHLHVGLALARRENHCPSSEGRDGSG